MPHVATDGDDAMPTTPLTDGEKLGAYAARRFLDSGLEEKLGLRIPFDVYFQDPLVAETNPTLAFDENCNVPWEPNIGDGPTSARFAVVDYDAHTEALEKPAVWDKDQNKFFAPDGKVLDKTNTGVPQFHQVNVWAIVQRALDFFESGFALGRSIPWGFDGNRLIVVPHAGPGENAYKYRWTEQVEPMCEMTVYSNSLAGRLLAAWELGLKPLARRVRDRLKPAKSFNNRAPAAE